MAIVAIALAATVLMGAGFKKHKRGLNRRAVAELRDAGVDKYLGAYTPVSSEDVGDGWTKHTFDPDGGNGPICIAGTPYSVFTRQGKPSRLLIFEQGGGACWQDFYNCNILAEAQAPPSPRIGIWDFDAHDNPFRHHSIVYMPYCDGSAFSGDNDVIDPNFPFGPVRFHRGLRNQSAGMDVAKANFPRARRITIAGSSAGGVGAAGFSPFLARLTFGNKRNLTVLNDAGPITINPDALGDIDARAADWQFGQFYPTSCTACDDRGDATEIIAWRLKNDRTIREGIYETDGDLTNRFFLDLLLPGDQPRFRELVVEGNGRLNQAYPNRYKRFIVAGDTSHTALQTDLFYLQDANGTFLNHWAFYLLVKPRRWKDIVEPAVPMPLTPPVN